MAIGMGFGINNIGNSGGANALQQGANMQQLSQQFSGALQQAVASGKMSPEQAQQLQQMFQQNPQQAMQALQQAVQPKGKSGKHKHKHKHHGAGGAAQQPQAANPYQNLTDTFSKA
jgi:hypothetical protein